MEQEIVQNLEAIRSILNVIFFTLLGIGACVSGILTSILLRKL